MSFLDHLEELRWRLIKALVSIVLFGVIGFIFSNDIIEVLKTPLDQVKPRLELLNVTILGVFMAKMRVAVMVGIICSLPVIVYQMWMFIAPGLLEDEKKYVPALMITTMLSFTIGGLFSYFVMIPLSLRFFALLNYGLPGLVNYVTLRDYLSYITILVLATGLAFELPVVVFILTKLGLITPQFLARSRGYAYLIILVLAAIFTPPDPFTQLGVGIPMMLLYEVSVQVNRIVLRRKDREEAKEVP